MKAIQAINLRFRGGWGGDGTVLKTLPFPYPFVGQFPLS